MRCKVGAVESLSDLGRSMDSMTVVARQVYALSVQRWGDGHAVQVIGRYPTLASTLDRLVRMAQSDSTVLVSGETGTGKELFARALYLLSPRNGMSFLNVNCAQYQEGQVIASELFGHKKGSFTGAVTDHCGIFQAADGGVVLLDEIGELSMSAQAMLLRTLSEGEVVPVGGTQPRRVNVRVIAATNKDLKALVENGRFRADLYYRLHYLHLQIPPLRKRGDDWELILEHYLNRLSLAGTRRKSFSHEAVALLRHYDWPGNVREVKALADTGFHLSEGELIEPRDFLESLEGAARAQQLEKMPLSDRVTREYERMTNGQGSFWELVHQPYMNRELARSEVREIVARGLTATRGSYKKLLALFGVAEEDYLRFMDFLRHHRLKPER